MLQGTPGVGQVFCTTLVMLWESEHTLVALGPLLEKAQKHMEVLTASGGTILLWKTLTIGRGRPPVEGSGKDNTPPCLSFSFSKVESFG